MNKILTFIGAGIAGLTAFLVGLTASATTMSSGTLGTSIDTMNGTVYDYFQVMLEKYWPFIVGFGILVAVWYIGRRLIHSFR